MTTVFPVGLDNFTNPTAADNLNSVTVPHADQHANENDAIEALEAKVGIDGSLVTGSLDYRISTLEGQPGHSPVTLGIANGLVLSGQTLSMNLAGANSTGTLSAQDWNTFNNKQSSLSFPLAASLGGTSVSNTGTFTNHSNTIIVGGGTISLNGNSLTFPLPASLGGTGIANGASATLTLPNAATTITTGGTLALGGFTLTVPATGTAALLATSNVFTVAQTINVTSGTSGLTVTQNGSGATGNEILRLTRPATSTGIRLLSFNGTGNTFNWQASTNLSAWSEAIAIRTNGFVGIGTGTTQPDFQLDVLGAASIVAQFKGSLSGAFMALDTTISSGASTGFQLRTGGTPRGQFGADSDGNVYVRNRSIEDLNHITIDANSIIILDRRTTTNNAVLETQRLRATVSTASTGGAAGFGVGHTFYAETATNETIQQQGLISTSWIDATNSTRKAKMSLSAYDTAARLGIEIEADGSAAKLGFYGVTTVARATTSIAEATFVENAGGAAVNVDSTFGGYTLQQIAQALQSIGILT